MIADLTKFISFKSISCKTKCHCECWNAAAFIQNKTEQFVETRLVQGKVVRILWFYLNLQIMSISIQIQIKII